MPIPSEHKTFQARTAENYELGIRNACSIHKITSHNLFLWHNKVY